MDSATDAGYPVRPVAAEAPRFALAAAAALLLISGALALRLWPLPAIAGDAVSPLIRATACVATIFMFLVSRERTFHAIVIFILAPLPHLACAAWLDGRDWISSLADLAPVASAAVLAAGCARLPGSAGGVLWAIIQLFPPALFGILYLTNTRGEAPEWSARILDISPLGASIRGGAVHAIPAAVVALVVAAIAAGASRGARADD